MKTIPQLPAFFLAAVLLAPLSLRAEATALPDSAKVQDAFLHLSIEGNGRDELRIHGNNPTLKPIQTTIPAGQIFQSAPGERMITLRAAELSIPPGKAIDVQLPAAALSTKNRPTPFAHYTRLPDAPDPRLKSLLEYLSSRPDIPRATSQLAVLALVENIDFAQGEAFAAEAPSAVAPSVPAQPDPKQVLYAIDALGILKEIAPGENFALLADARLKTRALRTPSCRGKAMQIYGLSIETEGGVPVKIGQLLHTKPGDNCPICRMRQQMEAPANNL